MRIATSMLWLAGVFIIGAGASVALAADEPVRPDVVQKVFQCRTMTDAQARLACYDAAVGEMASAEQRRDILFADRAQVNKTKKGLFGLDLSNLNIFGGDDDKDEVNEITGKIVSVGRFDRKWTLVLDDGARWSQIDTKTLPRDPKSGMDIRIRKAALGSFLANIDGMNAMRVKRTN